jgi:hypothetical protein
MLALAATGVLALLIGGGGAAISWVLERFDVAEFAWPGDLVFGAAVIGVALSVPAAAWATAYASTHAAPAGRALLAAGLGVGALVAISAVDRAVSLIGAAGLCFAVALPFGPWHRLTFRIVPVVLATILGTAALDPSGNPVTVALTAAAYPIGALLVWSGDVLWRALPFGTAAAGPGRSAPRR